MIDKVKTKSKTRDKSRTIPNERSTGTESDYHRSSPEVEPATARFDAYTAPPREDPYVATGQSSIPENDIAAGRQSGNQNTITPTGTDSHGQKSVFAVTNIIRDAVAKRLADERGLESPTRPIEEKRDAEHTQAIAQSERLRSSQKPPKGRLNKNKTDKTSKTGVVEGVIPVEGKDHRKFKAAQQYR
jgi:hypothetical protein